MRTLLRNGHVIPGDGSPELPGTDVLTEDGVITAIGKDLPHAAGTRIDASGMVVMPGLVDAHRHVWQAPLRGIGADMTLPDYFRTVLGRALSAYRPEDARLAVMLGAAEALNAGIAAVFDWNNTTLTPEHTDAVLEGYAASGLRAVVGHTAPAGETDLKRLAAMDGLITGGLAIMGPQYGSWEDGVRDIAMARELGLPVSMHASGGPDSPFPRMHEAGLLGPDLNLVHMNAMTPAEARMLADAGVAVTVTPVVEATMGHGASAFGTFLDAGGHAALGTDVVVNAPADLFEPMRDTLRFERMRSSTMYSAAQVLSNATVHGARSIGLGGRTGSITVGKRADIILIDGLSHPSGGGVVTAVTAADVHTVIVDGHVVKRDGRLLNLDLAALRTAGLELAHRALA
ncbi:amidohydrolase family protein [Glycomyces algeriensis]|uniref:TRZ/ATZ family hydrolase n=1 Tax=Glycomyces algeriensis TaxID=256037 RepID=A0A9W6G867_9ACTN|nr:amidohydrolase family protein [Glycomyces algeriensis]MDA1364301.1 amidohydrolase family protein [Glycomyces algeriensis]MDR7350333.1 cytosine/adenosine deaminase-related metal-dependent hydrolase [Glycomyces algeriensis]GLI43039.1 TRZ/ATZ family hydrolase [Glycomyces algeriensis]